ncbi:uncharacterized protein MELLADRAFT_113371 [Melampsora larici-populina 98AG31]|uniref:Uncharacterized protein n=1 Tax=Melampsora larici-populina (strain 98AG31 / pathotype 3-4-7) TaxID=747676 RepID=F4RMC0_MELLP|nr:uncharacterized protein MELLADRAFT_106694 [Melampsora larici-populina 98AG31]XP_007410234.1 uncharacterized protein MELLADRAFT_106695 [Melampsora larici-populina 98AG31]XP_007412309.1 uncharacterized protein MELLADRAFT_108399 [Melampsora larici-populina 98AG31]XP_007418084.1 uncharacterized protein MELLADRAFT_113371 [Melampsora larici-populina 98AG31]EGF98672.1 hypothetical protein MELLADRAFT_113371 [Melampsora larici-populina 98AG31]EGG04518.1 hypothetical protein MELLADRAFT_108399 [Melamp
MSDPRCKKISSNSSFKTFEHPNIKLSTHKCAPNCAWCVAAARSPIPRKAELEMAQFYVDSENLPVGEYPGGSFYKADAISLNFFEEDQMVKRATQVKESMDFLHTLIESKLLGSATNTDRGLILRAGENTGNDDSDDETKGPQAEEGAEDDLDIINHREGVLYAKKHNHQDKLKTRARLMID